MSTAFKSKIAVHRFLEEQGWQISKSQFYDHCKEGRLRPSRTDGKYLLSAVEKYAKLHCRRVDTGEKVNDRLERKQEQKMDLDMRRSEVQLQQAEHDLKVKQGRFVPRSEFELAIVARAVAFMAHLNHTVQQGVVDWIDLVEGDQSRAPELVDAISTAIEQRMGDFAADAEFDVVLEANQ